MALRCSQWDSGAGTARPEPPPSPGFSETPAQGHQTSQPFVHGSSPGCGTADNQGRAGASPLWRRRLFASVATAVFSSSYVRRSLSSHVGTGSGGKEPGEQRRGDGERSALNLRALTRCVRFVVCWATLLLREELRETQTVKQLLGMVPPGLWGQYLAAEQRMVPAPATAWQMVQGATVPGCPAACPGRGGTARCRAEGCGATQCHQDKATGSWAEEDRSSLLPPLI